MAQNKGLMYGRVDKKTYHNSYIYIHPNKGKMRDEMHRKYFVFHISNRIVSTVLYILLVVSKTFRVLFLQEFSLFYLIFFHHIC